MKHYANLMSEAAHFRAQAWIRLRRWALALALLGAVLVPLAGMRWRECRRVQQEHEALEARYAPIKRLNALNVKLRAEAGTLVRDERLALELSRHRPASALLGLISAAAASSRGELFIEHLNLTQNAPHGENQPAVEERMIIEAAATLRYDIAGFVKALEKPPIKQVRVTSDEVVSEHGIEHKSYVIECVL